MHGKDRKNKLRFTAKSDKGAYVKSAGGAGVPVAGQAGFFWRPALTAGTVRRMMGPFSGRRVKAGRTCGRGRTCTENYGGSAVYDFGFSKSRIFEEFTCIIK